MIRCLRSFAALVASGMMVLPAAAQTASTTGTSTGSTAPTSGGNTVSSSGSSANKSASSSSTGSTFQGTVPSSFSGGSASTTTTNTSSGTGSTTTSPSSSNPWISTYGNVYSLGRTVMGSTGTSAGGKTAGTTGTGKGFGQPVFATTTTSASTSLGQNTTNSGQGFNNQNIIKTPRYTTNLSEDVPYLSHPPAQMQAKLQNVLAQSTALKSKDQMRVVVNGDSIYLVGRASSERERRLAESLLLLTPGVREIENRLEIPGQP